MATLKVPFIKEEKYSLFQSIGVISQFPRKYASWLKFVDEKNKNISETGIVIENFDIDFKGFSEWFNRGTKKKSSYATYNDMLNYIRETSKA